MKLSKIIHYPFTVLKLKLNKVKFHYRVLGNRFYIKNVGKIKIGERVSLYSYPNGSSFRTALSTYFPESEIIIGNDCNLNGTVIHCNEKVVIGNKCMFGPGTIICDNDSHRVVLDYNKRKTKAISKPIILKENVWVGMNCLIMKGVTLGENSIIAAGSVVTKDVPPNSLFGGNPAKLIKTISD